MSYNIELENFEGPMDLLLYFIRRDELNIYDIPISHITKEFMIVIKKWDELNMVIAGEFIVMASTLMRIKVKMMLPRKDLDALGEIIDPRSELMHQLIEYKRFSEAAKLLSDLAINRSMSYTRSFANEEFIERDIIETFSPDQISLFDLAKLFKEAMDNRPVISEYELKREPIKLENQKKQILNLFGKDKKITFNKLIKILKTRYEIILTFLVILELIKDNICKVKQKSIFGNIELRLMTV